LKRKSEQATQREDLADLVFRDLEGGPEPEPEPEPEPAQ
jgi:hypothetical protein